MTDWKNALQWMIDAGTEEALGPKTRYWLWGSRILPREEYHQAVILVPGEYSSGMLKAMPKVMEDKASNAGFRLLKVRMVGGPRDFEGTTAYMFVGYAASDIWEKPISELGDALFGAPVVIDSEPVGLVEAGTLDGLWVARGAAPDIKTKVQVNPWPLIGAGVAILAAAGLVFGAVSMKKN
jgi:hypothetical protein